MSRLILLPALLLSASGVLPARDDARAQDDRIVPLGTIRTWYSVLDGDRKVGFAVETLESVYGPRRFRYTLRGELVVEGKDGERHHTIRAEALLDRHFAAREFRARVRANEAVTTLSLVPSTTTSRMRWTSPGAEPRSWDLPDDPDLFALPTQMFYALRQGGALADPGVRRARLLDTRAEGDPASEVVFRVGAPEFRTIAGRAVFVTPLTFLKPPPSSGPENELTVVHVDKYGRVLEAATRGGLKVAWARNQREAMEGITFLPGRDRLEPFDKARAFRPWPDDPLQPAEAPVEAVEVDALDSTFAQAKKDLAELRAHLDAGRLNEVRRGYRALLELWSRMRATAADEVPSKLAELDAFRDACEEVWDGATRAYREALAVFERAEVHLERDECAALEDRIADLRKLSGRLEVAHRTEGETIRRWIAQLEPELIGCRRRQELAAFRLEVTGTTFAYHERRASLRILGPAVGARVDVPYVLKQGRAVVNGEVYRVGDVEKETGVRIDEIHRHGIVVSYKGQRREVPLHSR